MSFESKTLKALEFRIYNLEQVMQLFQNLKMCKALPHTLDEYQVRHDELCSLLDFICEE